MVVQRGAKKYFCLLNLRQLPVSQAMASKLSGKLEDNLAQNLANRSIVMMVDDSASMGTLDCPGKKSRWQWCRAHIEEMYEVNDGMLQKNISIITFDSNFRSYHNCSSSKLKEVFESVTPAGETNMAPALEEAFALVRSQLERRQPALISVVSDGRPTDVESVKKSIIAEVNRLAHPELLSIVFIEVGTPEHYLRELDDDLVKQGAAADVVSVIPFNAVSSQSLTTTLASAVARADEKLSANQSLSRSVSTENVAKITLDRHVFTNSTPEEPKPRTNNPVKPPPVTARARVKAHPAGTPAVGEGVSVKVEEKPVEVKRARKAVLKRAANKTY